MVFFYSFKYDDDFEADMYNILEEYKIKDFENLKVNKLSGGQIRKLMIAIACCKKK